MKSTLAIDLGGRYTGVVSYTANPGMPSADGINAYVINTPNNKELTVSVKSRTQVRHRLRSQKRFKLARLLVSLIAQHKVCRSLSNSEKEALFGLLKRRGYSRYDSELDLSCLQTIEIEPFRSFIPELAEDESLLTQWESFKAGYSTGSADCIKIVHSFANLPDAKQFKKHLKKQFALGKEETEDYLTALSTLRKDALLVEQQSLFGHKHRSKFFDDIYSDMQKDSRLGSLIEDFGGLDSFYRTIGNICNLQLRALRWYFNDPSMKNPYYDDGRLKEVLIRAYKFFHYPKEEQAKCREILNALESADGALAFLQSFDPKKTIPPYEDQNNRKPPLDQTLLLNPRALDQRYGSRWELWVNNLLRSPESQGIDEQLDAILVGTDRKSRLQERQTGKIVHYTSKKLYNAYVLHRILDRTLDNDPYSLRLISKERIGQSNDVHQAMNRLSKDLGSQHLKEFLEFARDYYNEVDLAKRGLWSITQSPLLERADIHPPMKKGAIVTRLINNILCTENVSISQFWHLKVKGSSTVKSICSNIERTRKEYGNYFNVEYKKALLKHSRGEKPEAQDKQFLKIAENVQLASQCIAQALNLTEEQRLKFANPFSLAQLYTIIETEPNGFIKTSVAVNDENAWRTNLAGNARCVRLCSDTVRPFDGAVKKILERQAYELASLKIKELQSCVTEKNSTVDVTLLIESNEFAFSASMADIKNSNKAKAIRSKADRAIKRLDSRWQDKNNRIKAASRGLCPYTGQPLGDNGEIDHIISRSASLMLYGDILNSEPNLIYCSQKGNQLKSNQIKFIKDLAGNYLEKVFGSSDPSVVEEMICQTVNRLSDKDIVQFDSLSQQEQDALRHSLFLNSANPVNRRVRQTLAKQFKSRVNGTQAWFARQFIKTLLELSAEWRQANGVALTFDVYRLPAQSVQSDYRGKIAVSIPELAKPDTNQPVASHVVDALCVFGAALDNQKIAKRLGLDNLTLSDSLDHLTALLPQSIDIINIKRKPLFDKDDLKSTSWFKESIYAEEFLPIMVKNNETRIGFAWNDQHSLIVKRGDALLKALSGFLNNPKPVRDYEIQTFTINREKAFEFLHKVFIQPCSQADCQTATLLESMSYITQKTSLDKFFNEKTNAFDLQKDSKNFSIKIELDKQFGATGTILLPCQTDWHKEVNTLNQFAGQLDKKQSGQDIVLSVKKNPKKASLKHRRTRRVWSMPIVANISAAIRLQRQSHDGRSIYQLQMLENAKYKGLRVDEKGIIDWDKLLVADVYRQNSLTLRKERYLDNQNFIAMDHWLDINVEIPGVQVRMSPGEEDRRHICITQSKQQLESWIGNSLGSMWAIPAAKTLSEEELGSFVKNANSPILGKPRNGTIKFIQLGETVTYFYTTQNANAQMKKAYQEAYLTTLDK